MKPTFFLLAIFTLFTPVYAQPQGQKLNVLLILSDDLCNDLGCYAAPVITPNIDRLASRGVRLDRVYCQFPLCGPSRCSFMSGLRPETTGVLENGLTVRHKLKDVVTLPQVFRQNGYISMRVGKVYHLGIPNQVGTPGPDDPESWDSAFNPKGNEYPSLDDGDQFDPNPKNGQSFRRNLLKGNGEDQADYQSATEAIRLMNENKGKPFFLVVGFIRPHVPEVAPKKFFELYDISKIKVPEGPANDRDDIPPAAYHSKLANFGMNEKDSIESIRAYHATTSFMDSQAGRVLDELEKLNLTDKTIVIFMSDHGYLLGQHQGWQKMMLFEEACRVPMIFSYPGMKSRGVSSNAIVESIDMYPTVCQLAGLTGPKELQGKSFVPTLEDPAKAHKEVAFTQLTRQPNYGHSLRTDRYRYTEWFDKDNRDIGSELYDHDADPHEFTNLAHKPESKETVDKLSAQLHSQYPSK